MIVALFPPSSKRQLPNLSLTFCLIIFPTLVEPVKEIKGILLSYVILWPMSTPPCTTVTTLGFILFSAKTSPMILAHAIVIKDVVGAPFQTTKLPQIRAIAAFQPKTALGKLKAVITPTIPRGFHTSIMKCSGLSELKTDPPIVLESPQAISQTSMTSWISPRPSESIFPISRERSLPRASFLSLKAWPIFLTISPLKGMGVYSYHKKYRCPLLSGFCHGLECLLILIEWSPMGPGNDFSGWRICRSKNLSATAPLAIEKGPVVLSLDSQLLEERILLECGLSHKRYIQMNNL